MHDFNPGTALSGLFWVVQVPDDSVQITGNTLTINLQNVAVTDNFFFFGPGTVPATVSFSITYHGFGSPRQIQAKADPMGAFHWQGSMSNAVNSGTFSVAYDDGSFSATGSVDSTGLFGEIGTESNGSFIEAGDARAATAPDTASDALTTSPKARFNYVPRLRRK